MAVLAYSRSTRNPINGRLTDDKRADGKTSGGRSQGYHLAISLVNDADASLSLTSWSNGYFRLVSVIIVLTLLS